MPFRPSAALPRRALLGAALATPFLRPAAAQAPIRVTDVLGRELRLPRPAERVVLNFYFEDFTAIAGAAAWDRVVGISRALWAGWRPAIWERYAAAVPAILKAADIGNTDDGSFSAERVMDLHPDLVILSEGTFRQVPGAVAQLDRLGVPVLVADYNAQTLERHLATTRAIGAAMGTPERAAALGRDYAAATAEIHRRVAAARRPGTPDPRVYVELGQGGAAMIGNSYKGTMWGRLLDQIGARNLANGHLAGPWAPLSPELVLDQDPEFIFIAASSWVGRPEAVRTGYGVDPAETRARLARYADRPGWRGLTAIRQGELHAIEHGICRTLYDYAGTQYIAGRLYPEAFADLDPLATLRRYHENWLPVAFGGSWMLKLAA